MCDRFYPNVVRILLTYVTKSDRKLYYKLDEINAMEDKVNKLDSKVNATDETSEITNNLSEINLDDQRKNEINTTDETLEITNTLSEIDLDDKRKNEINELEEYYLELIGDLFGYLDEKDLIDGSDNLYEVIYNLSQRADLPDKFLEYYNSVFPWITFEVSLPVSDKLLMYMRDRIDTEGWTKITINRSELDIQFLSDFEDYVNWTTLANERLDELSDDIKTHFKDKLLTTIKA